MRRRNGSRFRYAPSPAVAAGSELSGFYRQIFTLPYDLDIGDDDSPVVLGDYLDEQIEPAVNKKTKGKKEREVGQVNEVPKVAPSQPVKSSDAPEKTDTKATKKHTSVKKRKSPQFRRGNYYSY